MKKQSLFYISFFSLFFLGSPVSASDAEYNVNQKAYNAIGVDQAYSSGFTGTGVTVAVVDNGTLKDHKDLSDQFSELQQEEFNVQDITDHGTPVSSIIAGKKDGKGMHGIAYNSKLVAFAVDLDDDTECPSCYQSFADVWNILASDEFDSVKIINNSFGVHEYVPSYRPSSEIKEKATALVAKDKLIVASAGNDMQLMPNGSPAGLPSFDASLKNNFISAIAYNPNYNPNSPYFLENYSNLAHYAQEWSLAAPVGTIYAASHTGVSKFKDFSGTSAAAPVISGAAAVVSSAFPYMGGKQLADVLFSTANKNYADFSNHMVQKHNGKAQFLFFGTADGYGKNWTEEEKLAIVQAELGGGYTCSSENVVCADVSYTDVFGQGLLNLGKAVKGPGYFDANRLSDSDYDGTQYLYPVDTKEYDSVWSNNIGQLKSKTSSTANVGLKKSGTGMLTLSGNNTYLGDTIVESGTLRLSGTLAGEVNVSGGSFDISGGRVENLITNSANFTMSSGYAGNLLNNSDAEAEQSGGTIANVDNKGTFKLFEGGYISDSLKNSGNFYLNGGRTKNEITNSGNFYLNSNSFTGVIQNTGTVYNQGVLKDGLIKGGTLVNTENGSFYMMSTPQTFINNGSIVLLPSENNSEVIKQMNVSDLNLVRGSFVLDVNNIPKMEDGSSYIVFTASNSLTVNGEFKREGKLNQFLSSNVDVNDAEKKVSISLEYLPISSQTNAPSLTAVERQTAKTIDRLFKNEAKKDFAGYYFLNEAGLRQKINTLYNQVKPLQFASLPLSNKLTRGVQTHMFERQIIKDPLRYEGRKNYYKQSPSRAPRGDVYQQYRPGNAPQESYRYKQPRSRDVYQQYRPGNTPVEQYRYYVPKERDVYKNYRPNGRSGGQSYHSGIQHQAWGQLLYHQGTMDADPKSDTPEAESSGVGIMFGWDFVYSPNFLWGLTAGYAKSSMEQGLDTTDVVDWRLGAYFSKQIDFISIDGVLMFGSQSYDKTRVTELPIDMIKSNASFGGTTLEAALNVGYDIQTLPLQAGDWSLRPYVGLTVTQMEQDAYQEKGISNVNLSVEKVTDTSVTASPGLIAGFVMDDFSVFGFQPEYVFFDFRYDHLLSGGSPKTKAYFSADNLQTTFDSLDSEEKSAVSIGFGVNGHLTDKTRLNLLVNKRDGDRTSVRTISASIIHAF